MKISEWAADHIKSLTSSCFYGKVVISFNAGKIVHFEIQKSYAIPEESEKEEQ